MSQDPTKKRSKLVLPSPQITDAELDEVCFLSISLYSSNFIAYGTKGCSIINIHLIEWMIKLLKTSSVVKCT